MNEINNYLKYQLPDWVFEELFDSTVDLDEKVATSVS